jgi:hypothetical protein
MMADTAPSFYPPIPDEELNNCRGFTWDGREQYIVDRIVLTSGGDVFIRQVSGNWYRLKRVRSNG